MKLHGFYLLLLTKCIQVLLSCRLCRHDVILQLLWWSGHSYTIGSTVWKHNCVVLFVICSHPVSHIVNLLICQFIYVYLYHLCWVYWDMLYVLITSGSAVLSWNKRQNSFFMGYLQLLGIQKTCYFRVNIIVACCRDNDREACVKREQSWYATYL